ncbi:MAG: hypothetical protein RMA76_38980 [Deltaproteobacteria bacterium]
MLARRAGYLVEGVQVERRFTIHVDGRPETITVRADMVLGRGGRRFVAEVKSGRIAPDPTSTATRRQLLEYAHVFDADGVLLFDMEAKRIRPVEFSRGRRRRVWPWLVVGLGLGWALARTDLGFWLAFLPQGH